MVSWDTRMLSSTGYWVFSQPQICCGDQSRISLLATMFRQPAGDFLALTQREREERTPPDGRSNPTVTRHQTTNGGMFFAKSAPDLMQRLSCLPTTPHVEFLLRRKPKPSPCFINTAFENSFIPDVVA